MSLCLVPISYANGQVANKEYLTKHFTVFAPKEKDMSDLLDSLEEKYTKVASDLDCFLDDSVKVEIYTKTEEFRKASGDPSLPNWVSGFITKENTIKVLDINFDFQRLKTLITHELTHLITRKINPGYIPRILWEGIATYEADQDLEEKIKDIDKFPSLEELFSLKPSQHLYSLAYSFVKFLIENNGYSKIVELLKVNYEKNEFNFNSIEKDYTLWNEYLKSIIFVK